MKLSYHSDPTPHLYVTEFVDPKTIAKCKFPDIPQRNMGRTGRDLFEGERGFEAALKMGWYSCFYQMTSPEFVIEVLEYFKSDLKKFNCQIDLGEVVVTRFIESREDLRKAQLSSELKANELFTRFDFQAGDRAYRRKAHLDWPRRIVGGVLFCADASELDLVGGEFAFFEDRDPRGDRRCHLPQLIMRYPVVANTGVLFLNHNQAYHGSMPIESVRERRQWIYYSISSTHDIWNTNPVIKKSSHSWMEFFRF